jgi:hypothetical protein
VDCNDAAAAGLARLPGRPLERKGRSPPHSRAGRDPAREIQYSSRTRTFTDFFKHVTKLHNMLAVVLEELPAEIKQSEEVKFLNSVVERHAANIVQRIYRPIGYEGDSKDYEFSRRSMEEHWCALRGRAPTPPSRNLRAGDRAVREARHLRFQP